MTRPVIHDDAINPDYPLTEPVDDFVWTKRRIWVQNNIKHRFGRRIDGWLFAWIQDAEAVWDDQATLIGETEDGDILMPVGITDHGPWWQGYWCWWKPTHWPAYIRSRHRKQYVMIELGHADG